MPRTVRSHPTVGPLCIPCHSIRSSHVLHRLHLAPRAPRPIPPIFCHTVLPPCSAVAQCGGAVQCVVHCSDAVQWCSAVVQCGGAVQWRGALQWCSAGAQRIAAMRWRSAVQQLCSAVVHCGACVVQWRNAVEQCNGAAKCWYMLSPFCPRPSRRRPSIISPVYSSIHFLTHPFAQICPTPIPQLAPFASRPIPSDPPFSFSLTCPAPSDPSDLLPQRCGTGRVRPTALQRSGAVQRGSAVCGAAQ